MSKIKNTDKKRRSSQMFISTLIMGMLTVIFIIIAYSKGQNLHIQGVKSGLNMALEVLPMLLFAFILAGIIQVLIPKELVSRWIGEESGLKGIFIGSLAGGLCPGGPYVSLPIAAGFLRSGASIATMVAFLTSWSLWAASRLPMEIGIMGWRFTLIRLACTFFFPPIAGLIARFFFSGVRS